MILNGRYPRILSKVFTWAKINVYSGIEFEERGEDIWAFIWCWDNSQLYWVLMTFLNRFSSNVSEDLVVLGWVTDALGPNLHVVSVHGGPHALAEAYVNYLGIGYQRKFIEYPFFDSGLFRRCLQWTASSVCGTLNPYSKTEFKLNRLIGAEGGGWMGSRPALKKPIIISSLAMPELVEVVANFAGLWPLIGPYVKETGRKDVGHSLVV